MTKASEISFFKETTYQGENQIKKVRFNTSGLPDSIYFIRIQGISDKNSSPVKQTAIIKHECLGDLLNDGKKINYY